MLAVERSVGRNAPRLTHEPCMNADYSKGCVVYVDESGSFAHRLGIVGGIGAIIVPTGNSVVDAIGTLVSEIHAMADPDERIDGEVKGSHLRYVRYDTLISFLKSHGLKMCALTIDEDGSPNLVSKTRLGATVRAMARKIGHDELGERYAKVILSASDVDFFYAQVVCVFFRTCVVQALAKGSFPPAIDVIFDPRIHDKYSAVLDVSVYLAFTTELAPYLRQPIAGTLGMADHPWRVKKAQPIHRAGLSLIDWLIYPVVGSHRLKPPNMSSVDPERVQKWEHCEKLRRRYEQEGVVSYPRGLQKYKLRSMDVSG